jgi:acetolactate synthase I/II/III large subunit
MLSTTWLMTRAFVALVPSVTTTKAGNMVASRSTQTGIPVARSMTGLDDPHLDWVKIGEGFGVPSIAVDTAEALARELEKALMQKGPRFEAIMA